VNEGEEKRPGDWAWGSVGRGWVRVSGTRRGAGSACARRGGYAGGAARQGRAATAREGREEGRESACGWSPHGGEGRKGRPPAGPIWPI
jgi:hypothetical protein